MSRYVRTPSKTFEFDGDTVTARFKPLTSLDLALVSEGSSKKDEVKHMGEILARCVVGISGLKDADGAEVPLDIVVSDAYFVQLAAEMFKALVEFSQPANP